MCKPGFASYSFLTNDRYIYDNPVHLVPELDGLRIVGHYSHEFLQRVPGSEIKYTGSRLRFIYIRAKATSIQMGSYRMLLSVYIRERRRSKKKLFSLSL